jgi:hypothetical protein
MDWPAWWCWEVEVSPHARKRMIDRDFSEVELRMMLSDATGIEADFETGRWRIITHRDAFPWEVIVEPIEAEMIMLVITAYPLD